MDLDSTDSDNYVYSDYGDDSNLSEEDEDDDDLHDDDHLSAVEGRRQRGYTVLTEADIRQRLEDDVGKVATVLSVSKRAACVLLRQYNWDVARVQDEWFANEDEVRRSVGLSDRESVNVVAAVVGSLNSGDKLFCKICYESFAKDGFLWVGCGHPFCKLCWSRYVSISIEDGLGCLALRCPEPSCRIVVDQDTVNSLVSDDYGARYNCYLLRSYVEKSRTIKWCPAPGCEYAIEFVAGGGGGGGGSVDFFDASCDCSYQFCWNCVEEAHSPVSCETARKWIIKSTLDGENVTWILANSKACPHCKTPIEKNQGCMHMTCRPPCCYEFCWLCLGSWTTHSGGNYSCNVYKKARAEGAYDEGERRQEMAKSMAEKYTHYYERWRSNHSSRGKAIADLNRMQTENLNKISDLYKTPESQLKFIMDAWFQIVECRRVLKWTYAYGYYIPEDKEAQKSLFEYLQGQAESALERLHQCAEEELRTFFHGVDSPLNGFQDFSTKLIDLTVVTRNYFANLNRAFANDLADIGFDGNKMGGGDS